VKEQYGNINLVRNNKYFNPAHKLVIKATKNGYVNYLSAKTIGEISFKLGAGRIRKEDDVDFQAGIYLNKVRNEYVKVGQPIATLYSSSIIDKTLVDKFNENTRYLSKPLKVNNPVVKVVK